MPKWSTTLEKKQLAYLLFLVVLCLFYMARTSFDFSGRQLDMTTMAMDRFDERLRINGGSTVLDTMVVEKEHEQLLADIEAHIVAYLYRIPDYSYIAPMETYLKYRPQLLEQFPSAVPLEKGDYAVSSTYGIRTHPISAKRKKHFGIDLAAPLGKPVYASASGTIVAIVYSKKGYGTHIILKHRFGFETLYGHLNKVLVLEGQKVKQHELIATIGSTGSSTGYHLHYEIRKNKTKIDPRLSLGLKKTIYDDLIELNTTKDGRD